MSKTVYLDYNATAPIHRQVVEAMLAVMTAGGNPSSVHQSGRTARNRGEEARAARLQLREKLQRPTAERRSRS